MNNSFSHSYNNINSNPCFVSNVYEIKRKRRRKFMKIIWFWKRVYNMVRKLFQNHESPYLHWCINEFHCEKTCSEFGYDIFDVSGFATNSEWRPDRNRRNRICDVAVGTHINKTCTLRIKQWMSIFSFQNFAQNLFK